MDVRAAYGVLAPTGRFNAGASDNVGSGYWTHAPSVGVTVFLTRDKTTTLSAFHMYEFHTVQEGTGIHPGQTANIDYSVARTVRVNDDTQLQLGLIGYGQWQTTDKTGPTISTARGQRTLPGQRAGLRVERGAAGAEVEPGPQVLQGVLEPIDVSGLHAADRQRGDVLGVNCGARRPS